MRGTFFVQVGTVAYCIWIVPRISYTRTFVSSYSSHQKIVNWEHANPSIPPRMGDIVRSGSATTKEADWLILPLLISFQVQVYLFTFSSTTRGEFSRLVFLLAVGICCYNSRKIKPHINEDTM